MKSLLFGLLLTAIVLLQNVSSALAGDLIQGSINSDSVQVEAFLVKSNEFLFVQTDSSLTYGLKALKLAKKLNQEFLLGKSNLQLGYSYVNYGQYPLAISHFNRAIQLFKLHQKDLNVGRAQNGLGLAQYHMGNYKKAIENYMEALDAVEKFGDKDGMGAVYLNISSIYNVLGDFDKDLIYCKKATETYKKLNRQREYAMCLNNMADTYNQMGKHDQAIKYLKKSIEIKEELDARHSLAFSYATLYETYELKNQLDIGKPYLDKSLTLFQETGSNEGLISSHQMLARYHQSKLQYQEATEHGLIAYLLAKKLQMKPHELDLADDLSNYYLAMGNDVLAQKFATIHFQLKDSLMGEEVNQDILNAKITLELNKKKQAIDQQMQAHAAESSKLAGSTKRINFVSISIISLLVVIQILGLVFYFRKSRSA